MKLHFLYGTETGTSEFLCEDMQGALGSEWSSTISCMDDVDAAKLDKDTFYVLVTSTFGSGDLPGTALSFFDTLQTQKPDLSGIAFAIFGLGDGTFGDTYNQGSEKLMTEMMACKARMIGERGLFDASSPDMPEDIGVPWINAIVAEFAPA